jgi:hypothetical protein
MNWRAFLSGMLGGALVVATLTFPAIRAQTPWGAYPVGIVTMIASGGCPVGTAEVIVLNGATLVGTLAANGDVGTTGGSNTITPTVATLTAAAQAFTGSSATSGATSAGTPTGTNGTVTGPAQVVSWPVGVPTNSAISMSGSTAAEAAHTHSVTAAGTNGTVTGPAQVVSWPAGVPTFAGSGGTVPAETFTGTAFSSVINHTHTVTVTSLVQGGTTAATTGTHIMTSTATGGSARAPTAGDSFTATTANPSGGVASITPAGTNSTAAFTPAGTVAWPAGVPTNATSTIPAETFTGSSVTSGAGSSHLHAVGTLAASTPTVSWPAGVPTNATSTIPAETFTGSALGTHTHTLTATGTNGTSSVTGTLNNFDNRSAFVKVIFCQKS